MSKKVICIECPRGCRLEVVQETVTGNACEKGIAYGLNEITNPVRNVSSVVRVTNSTYVMCPVKTSEPLPKDMQKCAVDLLKGIAIAAPITIGDVVLESICATNAKFVATRTIPAKENEGK